MMAISRVAPIDPSSLFSTGPGKSIRSVVTTRETDVSGPTIGDLFVPERKMKHTSSQLRLQLQWTSAFKMQIVVVRNAVICCVCAGVANGAFYIGNAFAFKSSVDQSLREFTMAMLVWMAITYAVIMTLAHLPLIMTQKFVGSPNTRPSFWFCAKKLMKRSRIAFMVALTGMIALGVIVQNTSLMHEYFRFRIHFYLAVVNNLTFTAGITLAVRRIYYEETYQGRDRRCAFNKQPEPRSPNSPRPQKAHRPPKYRTPTYWREYLNQVPNALLIVVAGGYVHTVLSWWTEIQEQTAVVFFTIFGVVLKLSLQEVARHIVLKKRVRSTRTMCLLVGVPTVLIDTQSRIVLLGTQTNNFMVSGTFALAIVELSLRAAKAAFVVWTTRRRSKALEDKLQEISVARSRRNSKEQVASLPSPESVKLEYELWRRQVISYHTAELTADMYAEYIAIGCSQSIVFWWLGHPLYPVLQIDGGAALSELDLSRLRFNQVVMLGFQSFVEIFVDYVCVVMEIAAGIEFDRIEGLSTFLGALFATMAVININISRQVVKADMTSQAPILASSRVSPHVPSSSFTSATSEHTVNDAIISKSAIALLPQPEVQHYSNQLRFQLQWRAAAKIQFLMFRNTIGCVVAAGLANGCFYSGNIFSLKSSKEQSHPEFLMATLVWTAIVHSMKMTAAYLPSLLTQRFLELPGYKPTIFFCFKKLTKKTSPYLAVSLVKMIGIGLLVQNTSLMHEYFDYKTHFYLGNLSNLIFTTGIAISARRIYYQETDQGHERRSALNDISDPRQTHLPAGTAASRPHKAPKFRSMSFWREYRVQFPNAVHVWVCGIFVHVVSWYGVLNRGTMVIMGFTVFGIVMKLTLQEAARHYILKKKIRSFRTMCVLVGLPTVLIDTQSRIILLGTQTNSFLVAGTFVMAVAELGLRVGKAAFIFWTIRRRASALEIELQTLSERPQGVPSTAALKLEFELWKRQMISYYTAELTADMYAEYIAIGCSQSIVFWWVGHPLYPALQLDTGNAMNLRDVEMWRFNQVAMLGFQFVIEIFVDYLCVVLEMAAGIDFERIESLSTFLGVLFMMMAVLNINISSRNPKRKKMPTQLRLSSRSQDAAKSMDASRRREMVCNLLTQIFELAERTRVSRHRAALPGESESISLIELIQASYAVFERYGIGPPDDAVYHRYLLSLSINPESDWRKKLLNFDLGTQPRVKRLCSAMGHRHGASKTQEKEKLAQDSGVQKRQRSGSKQDLVRRASLISTDNTNSGFVAKAQRQQDQFSDMLSLDSPIQRLGSRKTFPKSEIRVVPVTMDNTTSTSKESAKTLQTDQKLQMITTSIEQWRATQAVKQLRVSRNQLGEFGFGRRRLCFALGIAMHRD
ncbi:hypothetical protein P3T76_005726 [Phytophthora citrophthora]|uniref:Transmembrane protein n=1 Tax=Phytophthora citrophthora TaxID=4793 RepID=A0AAD9LQG9_9STRA|nr:hypothetical protein P3T76_005726 [Phytophthora citrophthora]